MKKIIIPISFLLCSGVLHAQLSIAENYIYTKTYLDDPTASNPKTSETVQYFDGLGRPKQIINIKATPASKDMVTKVAYDQFGRQTLEYLPVPQSVTQNGGIYDDPLANAPSTPYGVEKIYTEKQLENSPLDRILSQKQVGIAWNDKPVQFGYDINIDGEVNKYVATFNYATFEASIKVSTPYTADQLYKNIVVDEDTNTTIEFKNGKGQVVLVRKMLNATDSTDTYYVYNDYDQLAFVLSPKAVEQIKNLPTGTAIPDTVLNNLCYQYKYDNKNRLVEKRLPGKGKEYMVYDKADRLIMTQDANLNAQGRWLFTKYDQFGRPVYSGIIVGGSRESMQSQAGPIVIAESRDATGFTKNGIQIYYTNNLFYEFETVLSVNYYDTYPTGTPAFAPTIPNQSVVLTDNMSAGLNTKGFPLAFYIKNVEDDRWTKNYSYYDTKGRVIGTYSINYLGGYNKTESELDFTGLVKQTINRHSREGGTEKVITENFKYDAQNRLTEHRHKVDTNQEEILTQNTYNELSQLTSKLVGGTTVGTGLQEVNYQYNIRGWMTQINDPVNLGTKDLFGYKINYNLVEGMENPHSGYMDLKVKPRFNGNIAEVSWRTATTSNDNLRRYGYVYDRLNRLQAGFYQKDVNPSGREYFEKMDYDLNGNISHLERSGGLTQNYGIADAFDNLTYHYQDNESSNRLNTVTDASVNYGGYPETGGTAIGYDLNGNMTSHEDKGILGIQYNYLNLPNYIRFDKTYVPRFPLFPADYNVNTQYLYRADGTKLRKIYTFGSGKANSEINDITEYLDGFQYQYYDAGGKIVAPTPKFVVTSEGYFNFENNKYIYHYTDHLGNIRLSYSKNTNGGTDILEENNYYPFGLKHDGYNPTSGNPVYQYKYNGKELQTESGMYDYGARFYMPELGRWGVVDLLAETSRRWNPYNYAYNNPIRFIDPDGRHNEDWIKLGSQIFFDPTVTGSSQVKAAYGNNAESITGYNVTKDGITTSYTLGQDGSITTNFADIMATTTSVYNSGNIETGAATILGMKDQIGSSTGYIRETPSLNTQEGAFANPAAQLASTMLTAMQEAPLAIAPELIMAKYFRGITFYRTMSQEAADVFTQTGKMPAGSETFISPTRSFAEGYEGVTFKINIKHSTYSDLMKIGVKDASSAHPFPNMPNVGRGWKSSNAFFKVEGNQMNVGLGNGKALDIFNSGIKNVKQIPQ